LTGGATKEIRKTYQMGELYRARFYPAIRDGFREFKGLANYDYDYNYEFLSGTTRKTILQPIETGSNIPLYLQQIASNLSNRGPIGIVPSATRSI
jgi:hypothetical protein